MSIVSELRMLLKKASFQKKNDSLSVLFNYTSKNQKIIINASIMKSSSEIG